MTTFVKESAEASSRRCVRGLTRQLPPKLKGKTMTNERTAGSGDYSEIKRLVKIHNWAIETMRDRLADNIRDRMCEMPLSVMVRDGWREVGAPAYDGPEEFEILLGTGGPAVRIWGTLGKYGVPDRVELQNQDWFTQWERVPFETDTAVLRAFCSQFYLGD